MKNKKAMFFTLLAISILTLFLISYTFFSVIEERKTIQKRIETLNNFVFSVEQDLPRQLYIAGFRAIFLFGKYILDTGNYIDNVNSSFEELFFNGTLYNNPQVIMNGARFSDIQDSLNTRAAKINAEANLTYSSLTIEQEDPWHVKVTLTADLLIKDKTNLALWNKTAIITTKIPIENFEDPIYVKETNGLITNKINKTIYQPFVNGDDVTNLTLHFNNSFYIASISAPSFLNRLKGNLEANESGIESLVYLPKLSAQEIAIKDKSVVDYIYFSNNNPPSYNIQGMPSLFKLDNETGRLDVYGVGALAY